MISESFVRVEAPSQYDGTYTETTPVSGNIYRTRKAGKFFILKTAGSSDARSLQLLRREYELNVRLSHPHIAGVYTFDENSPVGPAIVMEYLEGRTLDKFLKENPPKEARERVFLQLLDAVGYIHRCSLIHNDIKPGNIIITNKDNDLKLIDFGLSDDDSNYLEKNLGATESYASPELLAYRHADSAASESPAASTEDPATANTGSSSSAAPLPLDSRSDIYSIGMIMKEIFPSRHKRIISRCTQKDREKRYSNTEELKRAWKNRNRPLQIATTSLLILLLALPTFLFFKERKRLGDASSSLRTLQITADSLRKKSESLRKTSDSLSAERLKEKRFNTIRDSLIQIIENEYLSLYNKSLRLINKQWERARNGEGGNPLGSKIVNCEPSEEWGQYWTMDGEDSKLIKKIKTMVGNLPLDSNSKALMEDALRSRSTRLSEDLYPKLYDQSYDKFHFIYFMSHRQ